MPITQTPTPSPATRVPSARVFDRTPHGKPDRGPASATCRHCAEPIARLYGQWTSDVDGFTACPSNVQPCPNVGRTHDETSWCPSCHTADAPIVNGPHSPYSVSLVKSYTAAYCHNDQQAMRDRIIYGRVELNDWDVDGPMLSYRTIGTRPTSRMHV